ncbi:hypothetical protein OG875_28450 [Streptomyces sp. NBC_01498]|uniref:hypothetical protein n=1 Tax=Streptomyces sp. NBC_01498 TaxID=2975870 RepID=UPI002E7B344E|nr:hypothetical protein [Streptomyces sp. NBC_01498]WTL28166.1 hypothetical protein OG875_28450 [Streptomyces sp. NBC_01498]
MTERAGLDESAETRSELLKADHWTDDYQQFAALCRSTAEATTSLRSVAHFSNNVVDFAIRPPGAPPFRTAGGLPWDEEVETEGRPGRQLLRCVAEFSRTMDDLDTGYLMRVLAVAPGGAMHYGRVKRGQHLVSVTLSDAGVAELDRTMNDTVSRIRGEILHQPNEHMGGMEGAPLRVLDGPQKVTFNADRTTDPAVIAALRQGWQSLVNRYDLQYAAYYRDWAPVCAGDALGDRGIGPQQVGVLSQARRAMYHDLAFRLRASVASLAEPLRSIGLSGLTRLVLDVQEGAVYIHWLDGKEGDFVLGVTIDQFEVANAETRLRELIGVITATGS